MESLVLKTPEPTSLRSPETLVQDIYGVFDNPNVTQEQIDNFGKEVSHIIGNSLTERRESKLRMSSIGQPCQRKLWYEINMPDAAEPLDGQTRFKFLIGHLIESTVLFLARLSGHSVTGEQDTQEIAGIQGHRDAVIDGRLFDVKSASPYSFAKFKEGKLKQDDAFGYVDQIQSYLYAGQNDELITEKDKASFLVVNKVSGELCVDTYEKEEVDFNAVYEYKKKVVAQPEPPARGFDPIPEGKSGNLKLPVTCSYCPFKQTCHPQARLFLYSTGPVWLTEVKKEPRVPEVIDGKVVNKEKS